MAAGNQKKISPIVEAIAEAELGTTGEIRVHLSRRWIEKDAFAHAWKLFNRFEMSRTAQRNGILLYVNTRRHKFAIVGDEGIHKVVGQHYWEEIAKHLTEDLHSTHFERAIATAVKSIGATLKKYFPADLDVHNPNELSNDLTHD